MNVLHKCAYDAKRKALVGRMHRIQKDVDRHIASYGIDEEFHSTEEEENVKKAAEVAAQNYHNRSKYTAVARWRLTDRATMHAAYKLAVLVDWAVPWKHDDDHSKRQTLNNLRQLIHDFLKFEGMSQAKKEEHLTFLQLRYVLMVCNRIAYEYNNNGFYQNGIVAEFLKTMFLLDRRLETPFTQNHNLQQGLMPDWEDSLLRYYVQCDSNFLMKLLKVIVQQDKRKGAVLEEINREDFFDFITFHDSFFDRTTEKDMHEFIGAKARAPKKPHMEMDDKAIKDMRLILTVMRPALDVDDLAELIDFLLVDQTNIPDKIAQHFKRYNPKTDVKKLMAEPVQESIFFMLSKMTFMFLDRLQTQIQEFKNCSKTDAYFIGPYLKHLLRTGSPQLENMVIRTGAVLKALTFDAQNDGPVPTRYLFKHFNTLELLFRLNLSKDGAYTIRFALDGNPLDELEKQEVVEACTHLQHARRERLRGVLGEQLLERYSTYAQRFRK